MLILVDSVMADADGGGLFAAWRTEFRYGSETSPSVRLPRVFSASIISSREVWCFCA